MAHPKDDSTITGDDGGESLPPVKIESVVLDMAGEDRDGSAVATLKKPRANRYRVIGLLGEGGMGRVLKVHDLDLDRTIAMKILRPNVSRKQADVDRFIKEARSTGRLEHPNIVPVYEVGTTRDGELYYTMRFVQGDSLASVISRLAAGETKTLKSFSLTRLLQVFSQICMAVQYAHNKGYIHRDLKPANIMVGEYGEVQVMDWGLASTIFEPTTSPGKAQLAGTPAYMSPEQTLGDPKEVDFRSDIYALGVLLYEILTLRLPFHGPDLHKLISIIQTEQPPPPRPAFPDRPVPPFLADVARKCMAKRKEDRYADARELNDAIQEYLEGEREVLRNKARADRKMSQAMPLIREYFELRQAIDDLKAELVSKKARVAPWEPLQKMKEIINLEAVLKEKEESKTERFTEITDHLYDALAILEEHREARKALARLYWVRFVDAEKDRDSKRMADYRRMVERFHGGIFHRELLGLGSVKIQSVPPGAAVSLFRFVETEFQLKASVERPLGRTPLPRFELPMGSFLLKFSLDGHEDVVYPFMINRNQEVNLSCRLPRHGQIPPGFIYVPEGPFLCGGDNEALHSHEPSFPHMGGFLIGKYPVTFAEYIEFLRDLIRRDPEEYAARCPRSTVGEPYCTVDRDGKAILTYPEKESLVLSPRFPVFGVSWHDAVAYAKWRSSRDGMTYTLPGDLQWEKAARGADGRAYPWGDRHLYCLCKNMSSRPGDPLPEPVGTFPTDVSPYGVADLAGGMHDWCMDPFEPGRTYRVVRGGSWAYSYLFGRCASRHWNAPEDRRPYISFRLCVPLFPPPSP